MKNYKTLVWQVNVKKIYHEITKICCQPVIVKVWQLTWNIEPKIRNVLEAMEDEKE